MRVGEFSESVYQNDMHLRTGDIFTLSAQTLELLKHLSLNFSSATRQAMSKIVI